jgi:hypothetical protein
MATIAAEYYTKHTKEKERISDEGSGGLKKVS